MFRHAMRATALAFLTTTLLVVPAPASAQTLDLGPLHIRLSTDAPPRARYERRPARPYRDSVWIQGYWDRQQDSWSWIDGRWEQPRHANARWIQARYTREGCSWFNRRSNNCRWRYEPAHWSDQRLVEGDDYRDWRSNRNQGNNRNKNKH